MKNRGERNGRSKLTLDSVKEIRFQYWFDKRARTKFATIPMLAKDYKVRANTISDIVLNKTWKDVEVPQIF